jgi:acyl carrier protein
MSDVQKQVLECISGVLGIPVGSLKADMVKGDIPEWDSLRHMQVVLALEDKFDVTFSDKEVMSGWESLQECIDSVRQRQEQSG